MKREVHRHPDSIINFARDALKLHKSIDLTPQTDPRIGIPLDKRYKSKLLVDNDEEDVYIGSLDELNPTNRDIEHVEELDNEDPI